MQPPPSPHWIDGWFEASLRVRYPEADPQGVVHHSVYLHYFEFGRTEMLRAMGLPYARIEEEGTRLMVTESHLLHRAAARYDEILRVRSRCAETSRVRIYIEYRILRESADVVVCEGKTVLAAVDFNGRPKSLPPALALALAGPPV